MEKPFKSVTKKPAVNGPALVGSTRHATTLNISVGKPSQEPDHRRRTPDSYYVLST